MSDSQIFMEVKLPRNLSISDARGRRHLQLYIPGRENNQLIGVRGSEREKLERSHPAGRRRANPGRVEFCRIQLHLLPLLLLVSGAVFRGEAPTCGRAVMLNSRRSLFGAVVFLLLLHLSSLVAAQGFGNRSPWNTLSGSRPLVVARGGFSGLFPDSSSAAYNLANANSISGVIQWCDLQLTKDGVGLCLPSINLENCTTITQTALKGTNETLDGVSTSGYFSYNYNYENLSTVALTQGIYSRPPNFDGYYSILTLGDLGQNFVQGLWVNVQHDLLYKKHQLSITQFLLNSSSNVTIDYLSSPEVAFLSNAARIFRKTQIKFIFCFLEKNMNEASTNQTYDSLLRNLTFIKTFASGILVPKNYIWPVTTDLYLENHTTIVSDAHKAGLEVYAAGFKNDVVFAYNYSYNPISEYLNFIDNEDKFSVDGVLTDFPISASAAIGCFSHINDAAENGELLVLSHNGASGVFPGCTDLAYLQAVDDGADFIDCPIQVTMDGVLICQSSINLMQTSTVTTSPFGARTSDIPEIHSGLGIFTFNLTWEEIQTLKPQISNPYLSTYSLLRNPANKHAGHFMTLSDFLEFAKNKSTTGVTIIVENAAFFAENFGYDIIGSVIKTLNDSGYIDNKLMPKVMIQSTNSSVLIEFRQQTTFDCLYVVDELVGTADDSAIQSIRSFAHAVAVRKESIFPLSQAFITRQTKLVQTLKAENLKVYVYLLRNEFVSQPWDFLSDPSVEIHNFVEAGVDGIITDFPDSGELYKKRTCLGRGDFRLPVVPPRFLLDAMEPYAQPPALSPLPPLTESNVAEPPILPLNGNGTENPTSMPPPNGSVGYVGRSLASPVVLIIVSLFLIQ